MNESQNVKVIPYSNLKKFRKTGKPGLRHLARIIHFDFPDGLMGYVAATQCRRFIYNYTDGSSDFYTDGQRHSVPCPTCFPDEVKNA
jgi:hypothetical protein